VRARDHVVSWLEGPCCCSGLGGTCEEARRHIGRDTAPGWVISSFISFPLLINRIFFPLRVQPGIENRNGEIHTMRCTTTTTNTHTDTLFCTSLDELEITGSFTVCSE